MPEGDFTIQCRHFTRPSARRGRLGRPALAPYCDAGTKGYRLALPNATIHMHQPLGGAQGQATDIVIQANEIVRLKTRLNQIFVKHTGKDIEQIERDTDRDIYFSAEQAVEYGLIDSVLQTNGAANANGKK